MAIEPSDVMGTVVKMNAAERGPAFPRVANLKAQKWVKFGETNLFPQEVVKVNSKSPVNAAIIRSVVTYICGKGVRDSSTDNKANATSGKAYVGRPNVGQQWDDVIYPVARDRKQFGGFYGQVIVNNGSETVSIFHQDFSTVRVGEIDAVGNPVSFRIAYDWHKPGTGEKKPLLLKVWPGMDEAVPGEAYIFYWWDYEPGLPLYCVPDWFAAMDYVKADGELGQFYNNSIKNGFTPSVVITMPSNPAKEKKDAFYAEMKDAFSGGQGASAIVILWGENKTVVPDIAPFNAAANADIYNNVEAIIFQKIISAHRLCSPTLAGVSGSGNLSGNAQEIIDSFVLFNYTVVQQMRREILDTLNQFQRVNKVADLTIQDMDVLPKIAEATGNPSAAQAKLSGGNPVRRILNKMLKSVA